MDVTDPEDLIIEDLNVRIMSENGKIEKTYKDTNALAIKLTTNLKVFINNDLLSK